MTSEKGNAALDQVDQLKSLGTNETDYQYEDPSIEMLEIFPNRNPEADYYINLGFPEFTSLCPKTGQPDFAHISIQYIPKNTCLESKSIKLYFFAFRNFGAFMESITNKILRDMVETCHPKQMRVIAKFAPRGALSIQVEVFYDIQRGYNLHTHLESTDG